MELNIAKNDTISTVSVQNLTNYIPPAHVYNPYPNSLQVQPPQISQTIPDSTTNVLQCETVQNSTLTDSVEPPVEDSIPVVYDEYLVKIQRNVNIVSYLILFISAIIVLAIYIAFIEKIVPPLNLWEVGNWWVFLLLFSSCTITILITGFALMHVFCCKGELGYKTVAKILFMLFIALVLALLVGMGAAETISKTKGIGSAQTTAFGRYVKSVCGNGTMNESPKNQEDSNKISDHGEKCEAVQTLQIGIYYMYIWAGDHFIENGAQSVHGEKNNSVFLKAQPLGLVDVVGNCLQYFADSIFLTENGESVSKEEHKELCNIVDTILGGPDKNSSENHKSVGDWAKKMFSDWNQTNDSKLDDKLTQAAFQWMHKVQTTTDSSDNWYTDSCKGQLEFWSCEGNHEVQWKPPACYASFLNLLIHDKPSYAPQFHPEIPNWIHLNKEVIKLDSEKSNKVNITCKDGSNFMADHVICTVSLGVLKEKADTLFQPALPEKKLNAIKHLEFGVVDKFHFEFPTKWWPDTTVGFNFLWDSDQWGPNLEVEELKSEVDGIPLWCRSILGFYTVGSHPTALNSWIAGPAARFVEKLPQDYVKNCFIKVLRKFLGSVYKNIPEPINFQMSSWYSNPFTRGSYSHRGVGSDENNAWAKDIATPILKDDKPTIGFAGEATHSHFYATVHGAYDSGLREAARLINYYNGNNLQNEPSEMFPYNIEDFNEEND